MKRFTAILAAAMVVFTIAASAQEKISEPLNYKGYSNKEYSDYKLISQYVEMRDGVKLAVDVYLPRKGPRRDSFPAIVEYTPYSRAFANQGFAPLDGKPQKNMLGGRGAIVPMPFCFDMSYIEQGYALIIADIRGSGASFGHRYDMSPQIGKDGADLIEWIAAQPWSDGNVGMKGGSYMGISQLLTAAEKPPHLKAIFLMIYPFGHQDIYAGGIYNNGFMGSYADMLWTMNMNMSKTVGSFPVMPSAPVVDEDGDGKLLDEIPIDKDGDGSFVNDYNYPDDPNDPPQYEDGAAREHIYFLATKDHEKNLNIDKWFSKAKFTDSDSESLGLTGDFGDIDGYDIGPASRAKDIMDFGIPIYHVGGWFDTFIRSDLIFYSTTKQANPSKFMVMPVYHIMSSPFLKYFGEKAKFSANAVKTEQFIFFDHYLKGIDNNFESGDPITLYVMGKGVRQEADWPLARAQATDFYFDAGGGLSTKAGDPGTDVYTADFTHSSEFGPTKGNRWKMYIIPSEVPDRAELDEKCLTYTTAPLEQDTEVTGHPIVDMWVSSTAPDGDFFVYMEDVTEDGQAILVTEQPLRAGFAGLKNNDTMIRRGEDGIDVKPELPYHGLDREDYNPEIFKDGNIVNLKFDLMPTSWVFKKGHRIRVSIAAADWPTFPLNEQLSPSNDPANPANIVPDITFHRDTQHQSKIVLPVVGE